MSFRRQLGSLSRLEIHANSEEEKIGEIHERIQAGRELHGGGVIAAAFRGERSPGYLEIREMAQQIYL
jgi:hypothetical protein